MSQYSLLGALTGERSVPSVGLLSALVASQPQQLSIAEAARRGEVSKATATRAVGHLVESGLVARDPTRREIRLSINVDSPLYSQVVNLLWIEHGTQAPDQASGDGPRARPVFEITDWDVQRLVPPQLQQPGESTSEGQEYDGPALVRARSRVLDLERLAGEHASFDSLLDQAWHSWHDERDRDLYHLIGHLGEGSAQAARALRASAVTRAARERGHVGGLAWVHATYAVAAEATLCAQVEDHLRQTLTRAREFHRAETAATDAAERLDRARTQGRLGELPEGFEQEVARLVGRRARALPVLGQDYGYGGRSRPESVGTAGERLLLAHVQHLGEQAAVLADDMAAEDAVARWQQDHPDIAAQWPLPPNPTGTPA